MTEILPYCGVGPLRFGMGREEVIGLLGHPRVERVNHMGQTDMRFTNCAVLLSRDKRQVEEIMLFPSDDVVVEGVRVFCDPQALEKLAQHDGAPQLVEDTILLLKLGIAVNDFRDATESNERQVTAFALGVWDELLAQSEPLSLE